MGLELLWVILKFYVILDVAFIITSLFTLQIPAWNIVKAWVEDQAAEERPGIELTRGHIVSHTMIYSVIAFIAFPFLAALLLIDNKSAVFGYSKSIIKGIRQEYDEQNYV